MDKPAGKYSTPIRMFLWLCVIAYMAALPHLIIVFKFILGLIPLDVIKALPAISLGAGALAYLGFCRIKGRGYGITTFIIPATLLIAGVLWLERNPIKHVHIPLYAVLVGLIYFTLRRADKRFPVLIASFIYAAILGVFDEIHHGIHPERYFGWKDMVINAAGAGIGALLIGTFLNIKPQKSFNFQGVEKTFWTRLTIVLVSAIITALSVIFLFGVTQNEFKLAYPASLFVINVIAIFSCLGVAVMSVSKIKTSLETELFLFFPALIFASIQMLICVAYANNIAFQ